MGSGGKVRVLIDVSDTCTPGATYRSTPSSLSSRRPRITDDVENHHDVSSEIIEVVHKLERRRAKGMESLLLLRLSRTEFRNDSPITSISVSYTDREFTLELRVVDRT